MTRSDCPAHRQRRFVAAAAVALIVTAEAPAQPPATNAAAAPAQAERVVTTLNRRGDLTLRESTLEGALFTISELWGVNIVAGDVEGEVNGVFKNAPLREILDSILLSNGYAYRPVGGSLVVSRMEQLGQVNPFFVSETLSVGAAEPGEVVDAARLLSTPQGQVRALPSAHAVLVVDFPDRVEKIRALIRQIDAATRAGVGAGGALAPQQLEVAYFRTHYIAAEDAAKALAPVLSADGRVSALEGEDRLLAVDYAENVGMVEAVLARIDRPRPQVNIRALIYDIALSDLEEIGVNWNLLGNGVVDDAGAIVGGDGVALNTVTRQPFGATDSGGSFTFFSLNADFNVEAVVLALQQADDSRLLADPNVTVSDNEPAKIESITEVPFQQLTQTSDGGQIGTTSFREAGVKLDVIPKIARDGTIQMTVVPEFSRVAGFTAGDNQPIIETRRATTDIRVQSGQTAMIAGLRQRSDVGDFDGIPMLKDLRFLGHLFRARSTQINESELVVFLTPRIVGYADPLGCRERLTADTIECRLDRIPAAEGCPACGLGCGPTIGCGPYEAPPSDGFQPEVVPTPTEAISPAAKSTGAYRAPVHADDGLRRLPEVDLAVQPAGAGLQAPLRRATVATPDPLRPDYQARFRATGGVYPGQQRVEPTAEPDDADRTADRSWFDRFLRR